MKKCAGILLSVLFALALCLEAEGAEPRESIDSILLESPFDKGLAGVFAVRMNGDTLACFNSGHKFVPASNVKLVTTGIALNTLGGSYKFKTTIACDGDIVDSTLVGNLYIIGGGDPTTGCSEEELLCDSLTQMKEWLDIVRDAGIRRIDGLVLGDPRFFGPCVPCDSWDNADLSEAYGAVVGGLNFNQNSQSFFIEPGKRAGDTVTVHQDYPLTPWLRLQNDCVTGGPRSGRKISYSDTYLSPVARLSGSCACDLRRFRFETSNFFAAFTCAAYFSGFLSSNGIASNGFGDVTPGGLLRTDPASAGNDRVPSELKVLGTSLSPSLFEIVHCANINSNNFFAEALYRIVAKELCGEADYGSCRRVRRDCLDSLGLTDRGECRLVDGSGLSRHNYASPSFFVGFLRAMASTPVFHTYLHTLPQAGEGTLEMRLRNSSSDVRTRVHMKSGSMDGVRCFSGYITASDDNPDNMIVFSILTNNITASSSEVYPAIDKIIDILASNN